MSGRLSVLLVLPGRRVAMVWLWLVAIATTRYMLPLYKKFGCSVTMPLTLTNHTTATVTSERDSNSVRSRVDYCRRRRRAPLQTE